MTFINRSHELERLERMALSGQKELLVLYGRRRLGKTALLREFARTHKTLFFSCPLSTTEEALRLFQLQMADAFNEPLLARTRFAGWPDALAYVFEQAARQNISVVFDEFPYLMRSVPGIEATLQHLWDAQTEPVWIGLCGSLLSVMQDKVLGADAPLYGRRTEQLHLGPMSFREVSLFYPSASFEERAYRYAVFGGVPAYAERAARFTSLDEAVTTLILQTDGILYQEPDFLVREELREPGAYFSILHSLAAGMTRPNQIAQDAGVPHSSITKYLDVLGRLQMVRRQVPITEKNPERSTKGIYVLTDPFLRFWFRYVFPYRSTLELGRAGELYQSTVKPDLSNFLGAAYEQICAEEILRNGPSLLGFQAMRMGRYWDSKMEIDLVVEDARGEHVAFIECKWSRNVNVKRLLSEVARRADLIPTYAGVQKSCYIMSRTKSAHPNHIRLG